LNLQPTSYIELDLEALKKNFKFLNELTGTNCELLHVVKGNAYGHGIDQFIPLIEACGGHSFGVFDAFEAQKVFNVAKGNPRIVIMGMIDNDQLEWAILNGVEFYIFDLGRLEMAIQVASNLGRKAKIHLEVETGMYRTGLDWSCGEKLVHLIAKNKSYLEISGVCTHFAGSENISNYFRILGQKEIFQQWLDYFEQENIAYSQAHSACSAAAIRYPFSRMSMVRSGILQYGFWPSNEIFIDYLKTKNNREDPLERVLSWKSKVMNVKAVPKDSYVGYGNSYLASEDMTIASVPVGYSHGFARSLSNQGRVLINGERVPVVGTVNMNMVLVDVTRLSHVNPGDEVVLIGRQEDKVITVSSFSEFSNQLNYELLTRLPIDIPRIVKSIH